MENAANALEQTADVMAESAAVQSAPGILRVAIPFLWLSGALLLAIVLCWGVMGFLLKSAQTRKHRTTAVLLESFRKPIFWILLAAGAYLTALSLFRTLEPERTFPAFPGTLLRVCIIVMLTWGLWGLTEAIPHLLRQTHERFDTRTARTLQHFFSGTYHVLLVIFAGVMIVTEFGYNVSSLIAGLGLGGLTFALAAQDSASNFFGGIVILFEKPFQIGDWISADTMEGTVEDISFRSTRIRTLSNALTTVPNSKLCSAPITNWTRMEKRLSQTTLGLTYSTPKSTVEAVVRDVREMLEHRDDVHPEDVQVRLSNFSESSIDILVMFYTVTTDIVTYRAVIEDVNLKIMDIMAQNNASFAFPSRSIYFETPPAQDAPKQSTHPAAKK